jgi:hypothetical protein
MHSSRASSFDAFSRHCGKPGQIFNKESWTEGHYQLSSRIEWQADGRLKNRSEQAVE